MVAESECHTLLSIPCCHREHGQTNEPYHHPRQQAQRNNNNQCFLSRALRRMVSCMLGEDFPALAATDVCGNCHRWFVSSDTRILFIGIECLYIYHLHIYGR